MKGKGKGKDMGRIGKPVTDKDTECPLSFTDFPSLDSNVFPCTTQIFSRTEDSTVSSTEIEALRPEIELMLATVVQRSALLEQEYDLLMHLPEKKSIKIAPPQLKRSITEPVSHSSPPPKLSKLSHGKPSATGASSKLSKPKALSVNTKLPPAELSIDPMVASPLEIPMTPQTTMRAELTQRLWDTTEPYCSPVTQEHIQILEEMLKSSSDEGDCYKIPSKTTSKGTSAAAASTNQTAGGKSISNGGKKSKQQQRGGGGSSSTGGATSSSTSGTTGNVTGSITGGGSDILTDSSPFGDLTQHLVSALLPENDLAGPLDEFQLVTSNPGDSIVSMSPRRLAKFFNLGNPAQLEKIIQKELEDQGILEPSCRESGASAQSSKNRPGGAATALAAAEELQDEVLQELKSKQAELKHLSQRNQSSLNAIIKAAKLLISKQEIQEKINKVTNDVQESYRKFCVARQKKKSHLKKERELFYRHMKERQALVRSMDEVDQLLTAASTSDFSLTLTTASHVLTAAAAATTASPQTTTTANPIS